MDEGPEPDERPQVDLLRSLGALQRVQALWLADLGQAANDPSFVGAFRRWQEELTLVKLCVHRAENRLLHYLIGGGAREWREYHRDDLDPRAGTALWVERLNAWFLSHRVETSYRRLGSTIELAEEAVTADIVTDLAAVAACAESTMPALAHARVVAAGQLDDLAYYHVVAPWRRHGLPAALDVLRWLAEILREHEEL